MVACICGINPLSAALHASCITWICANRKVAGGGEEVWKVAEPFDHAAPPLTKYHARFSTSRLNSLRTKVHESDSLCNSPSECRWGALDRLQFFFEAD